MKRLAGILALFIAFLCMPNPSYSTNEWKSYTIVDGLAGGNIRAVTEDKEGNLWIATEGDGVSRYNGEEFHNISTENGLASNHVRAILLDKQGNLWFATGAGLCKCAGKGSIATLDAEDRLVSNSITTIAEDREGNLWLGTEEGGVSKYDGEKFENFTIENGLADNYIRSILEDSAGNLWFGTGGKGLSRYDGEKFTNFTTEDGLIDNYVGSALMDDAGNLWFGTEGGLSKYDGEKFTNFTTENGLPDDRVRSALKDSDGNLWFGTVNGVSKYDGNEFENFTSSDGLVGDNITAICESRDGYLWFATWGHGISKYDTRIQHYLKDEKIEYVVEDKNGNVWFGAEKGHVFRYDGKTFRNFTNEVGLISDQAPTILEDTNDNLWFTGLGGIIRYNGTKFQKIERIEFKDMLIEPAFADSKGNLWFSVWEDETCIKISRYDGERFQDFPIEGSLYPSGAEDKRVLEDKKGNIWFVTAENGIYKYNGRDLMHFTTDDGLAGLRVSSVEEDKAGNLWFGIRQNDRPSAKGISGLSMYTGEFSAELKYQSGLDKGNIPIGLKEAFKNNGFLISQDDGVAVKEAGQKWFIKKLLFSVEARFSSNQDDETISEDLKQAFADNGIALSNNTIVAAKADHHWLIVDRDKEQEYSVWENEDKLDIYDNRRTYIIRKDRDELSVSRFIIYSDKNSPSNYSITGIMKDHSGDLWFRTYLGGVCKYDGKSFERYTKKDGLVSNTIRSMLEDKDGNLWFGSQGAGVNLYDGENFQIMTKADGLINNTAFLALEDNKGSIWIRYAVQGLTKYTPRKDVLPSVEITKVVADKTYPVDRAVKIPPNSRVVFHYRGISLSQFDYLIYNCRLEGQGDIRKDTVREREIDYENLKPGKYEFQVRTFDRDLNYSTPQSIAITVLKPWYENPYYIAFIAFVLLTLFVSLIKLRSSRKIAAKLREEIRQNEEEIRQKEELEKERIREELQNAHDMQMNLMSGPTPKFTGFEVYGRCEPAYEVGGDFYRFIESHQGGEKFAIALSDVCGKGMKAAWIALMSDGMLHFLAKLQKISAAQLLYELNNGLCERFTDKFSFVAFCFALIDVEKKTMQFSNGGQMQPIIKRGEDLITITEANGLLLGIIPDSNYEEKDIMLEEEDIIVFYTDGIVEATNQAGYIYLTDRLEDLLRKIDPGLSPAKIADEIFKDVYAFVGNEAQEDDMTVVVLKVKGEEVK